MRFSSRIAKIIFIVTALLLLVISTVLYIQVNDLVEANDLVNHTNEVKLRLSETLSFAKDSETAQRGFILTKDSLFLQPYANAFEKANSSIEHLRELFKDSEEQQKNLEKLDTLIQIKFAAFNSTINSYFSENAEMEKRQILLSEKALMDSIRKQANRMENIETRQMGKRQLSKTRHDFLAPLATVLLIIFSLAVLLLAYYRITLDLKHSESYVAQMKSLNAELLEKNRQLQITNNELDSFNYISSHDLQEPVRKIRTFISMIEETEFDKLSEKNKHNFQRIQVAAIRIQELLHDLLIYSQLNIKAEFTDVDLNEIMEEVKEKLSNKINETKAVIACQPLPAIKGIGVQLQQLFEHLIGNTLKYKHPEMAPEIRIEYVMISKENNEGEELTADSYHKLSFIDNGIGFNQEHEHKVFELFSQLHNKEYDGTGIGLTICKKIVQNHNGHIKVNSEINKGTVFYIYLPV